MRNAREILNIVREHLLNQKCRSVDSRNLCSYRGEGGKKCAAGVLIPDELYDPSMETKTYSAVCENFPAVEELNGASNTKLINALQIMHDSVDPANWGVCLKFVNSLETIGTFDKDK